MPVPREGDTLCPTGAVVLRGRRGVLDRWGRRSTWKEGRCTWCGDAVPPGRRRLWCSQWCVDAYQATQPEHQRAVAQERDGGRCCACGMDTERMRVACLRWMERRRTRVPIATIASRLAALLTHLGRTTSDRAMRDLLTRRAVWWDLDHVVPIADGGHPYDLRNLRTLCWWCHQAETSEAATRRAERKRGAVEDDGAQVCLWGDGRPC